MAREDENQQFGEIAGVQRVVDEFKRLSEDALNALIIQQTAAEKRLREAERRERNRLLDDIGELQLRGLLKTNAEVAKYTESELHKQQTKKLTSEIEILRAISAHGEEERKKEAAKLEREKKIIELRNKGNEEEARQLEKEAAREKKKEKRENEREQKREEADSYEFGDLFREAFEPLQDALDNPKEHVQKTLEEDLLKTMKGGFKAIEDGLNAINSAISSYGKYQTAINARLQGSSAKNYSSVVNKLESIAFSPLLRAEDLYSNLSDIVGLGIATNVEQKALFATVKDGIATTFDVTSDTLRRMIRVQQNDSTAARLGMEAYLTKFLNTYVESTEYLQSTFDSVASSLFEASAMLGAANGASATAEFEYVVQKWLGTLSGVGFSDTTAQEIATALGQLGSGDVEALSSSNMQNLLVMAANKANLSYAEMLTNGLTAVDTNNLMRGLVEYLQEVANTGNNVVKNQLSKVFGVTVSDLIAVSNLENQAIDTVHKDMLSYKNMYGELQAQFKELPGRIGISNILENLFANLTYQTGMSIGSNPVTYALWKITDMIQGVTGGINVPFINAMGFGFDLNTSVENLMKLGIVGVSTLGNIGKIAGGLASIGNGATLLKKVGVSENAEIKSFGGNSLVGGKRQSGTTTSESSYVGNSDSDSYYDSTINAANDENEAKVEQKRKEYKDPVVEYLAETVKLEEVYDGFGEKLDTIIANQLTASQASSGAATDLLASLMTATSPSPTPGEEGQENMNTAQLPDININSLLTALIQTVVSQIETSGTATMAAVAPVASSLVAIDTSSAAILAQVTALNGTVLDGVSEVVAAISAQAELQAANISSAYNNFQEQNNATNNYSGDVISAVNKSQEAVNNSLNNVTTNIEDVATMVPNSTVATPTVQNIIDNSASENITNTSNITNTENIINNTSVANTENVTNTSNITNTENITNNSTVENIENITTNSSLSNIENITNNYNISNIENVTNNSTVDPAAIINEVNNNFNNAHDSEYNKYVENIGAQQLEKTQVNDGNNYDISDYLIEIDFAVGFKSLVDNVAKILEKLSGESSDELFDDDIAGFTQFSF